MQIRYYYGMDNQCHRCGTNVVLSTNQKVGFRDACHKCSADLHACMNCNFYDPTAYNSCRESNADRVVEKDRANYCDYFRFGCEGRKSSTEQEAAKKKLDDLFK